MTLVGEITLEPANKASIFHNHCSLNDGKEGRNPLRLKQDWGRKQDFTLKARKLQPEPQGEGKGRRGRGS